MVELLRAAGIQDTGGCGYSKAFGSGYCDMKVLETTEWLPGRGT